MSPAWVFDSIDVDGLLDGLERLGIPPSFFQILQNISGPRHYYVEDGGAASARYAQSWISQRCTLSLVLFILAMAVLLRDAVRRLGLAAAQQYLIGNLADWVSADDALLWKDAEEYIFEYPAALHAASKKYGMELRFGKFQPISTVAGRPTIPGPDGSMICCAASLEYFGSCATRRQHLHPCSGPVCSKRRPPLARSGTRKPLQKRAVGPVPCSRLQRRQRRKTR